MSMVIWAAWAAILTIQNFSFTLVSRARNSGSPMRHVVASVFSNGVWFLSQTLIFAQMMKILNGEYGVSMAVFAGLFYTTFTVIGSVAGHYFSLKTEKGKGAVGASNKYAQITKREWADLIDTVYQPKKEYYNE